MTSNLNLDNPSPRHVEHHPLLRMTISEAMEYVTQASYASEKELEASRERSDLAMRTHGSPQDDTSSLGSVEASTDALDPYEHALATSLVLPKEIMPQNALYEVPTMRTGPKASRSLRAERDVSPPPLLSSSPSMRSTKSNDPHTPNDSPNNGSTLVGQSSHQLADTSQASTGPSPLALLGRHEHCTCPIKGTDVHESPSRPHHEAFWGGIFVKKSFQTAHDGNQIFLDHNEGLWYLIVSDGATSVKPILKIVASGTFIPRRVVKQLFSSSIADCPCYDELYGAGAGAKAKLDFDAWSDELFRVKFQEDTGYTTAKYSLDEPGDFGSKERHLGKARTVLEKWYLTEFPFLKRQTLDFHVKEECELLDREYEIVLQGILTNDELIQFYNATAFDTGTNINDTNVKPSRTPFSFPLAPAVIRERQTLGWERVISALTAKYFHTWPWLGLEASRILAEFNNCWLQEQLFDCGSGLRVHNDDRIIAHYGAVEYDLFKWSE
ncbi:hypothetical protein EG329_008279 [Mollisiaceae sp. DMI_Dod_QoI]|nr:hypothetical protein EG329_008279 [Helotiales sp. DMI_Dod_QoI]